MKVKFNECVLKDLKALGGEHNITADVEVIAPSQINDAYERMLKSDIRYRFSIDMSKA